MATVDMILVKEMAKAMAPHTKTQKGRVAVQEFLEQEYPQFKTRHILMIVNYNELKN